MKNQQPPELYSRIKGLLSVNWSSQICTNEDLTQEIWTKLVESGNIDISDSDLKKTVRTHIYEQIRPRLPRYRGNYSIEDLNESMQTYVGLATINQEEVVSPISSILYELMREIFIEKGIDNKIKEFLHP